MEKQKVVKQVHLSHVQTQVDNRKLIKEFQVYINWYMELPVAKSQLHYYKFLP